MPPPTTSVAGFTSTNIGSSGLLKLHAFDGRGDQRFGLDRARLLALSYPRDVLADVGHLAQVRIHTGVFARPTEGLLVQVWRARGHHDAGETLFFDILFDHLLPQGRAHELVILRHDDVFEVGARPLGDLLHVDRPGDVAARNGRRKCRLFRPSFILQFAYFNVWLAIFSEETIAVYDVAPEGSAFSFDSNTGIAGTSSLPKPSFLASIPQAMPSIWVK